MRYFFEISYHGKNYHGWQRQKNAVSVQQVVEEALSLLLKTETSILGSGRTDTGVHCKQQFFHTDILTTIDPKKLQFQLNSYLPPDISINAIAPVQADAHARFTALSRNYEYCINRKKDPFLKELSYYYTKPLDIKTMNEATALLIGEFDFEAFSKVKTEVNNFVCNITEAKWQEEGDLLLFRISANRFLRGMVRAIVGTLLMIGSEKISIAQFKIIIASKNRKKAGYSVPAKGLFLTKVTYPAEIFE